MKVTLTALCPWCHGRRMLYEKVCSYCHGEGVLHGEEEIAEPLRNLIQERVVTILKLTKGPDWKESLVRNEVEQVLLAAIAEEREACADLADQWDGVIGDAIRARGKTP
jgi:hypothetical protein